MNGSISDTASPHRSSPNRSWKRRTAMPSTRSESTARCWRSSSSGRWKVSAPVAAGLVSLEDGGGGVKDGVEVYHFDPGIAAHRELFLRQAPAPVRSLGVVAGLEQAEHALGRDLGEMRVVDEADRVEDRAALGLI